MTLLRARAGGTNHRPDRRRALHRFAAAGLIGTATAKAGAVASGGLPAMRRGFNLTHWFEYEQGQSVSMREMRELARLGLDHVRLPFDPVVGGWRPDSGGPLGYMKALRSAVEQGVAAGLEVVVDLHTTPETKRSIEMQPAHERQLIALWSQLARALADLPTAQVAFELFNEPQYYGLAALRWPALQSRLLAAVREHAPRHLVLLSGNEGGSFKGLLGLPLVRDPAVTYVYHYYDPFLFTHQGAAWLDPRYTTAGLRRDLRYPAEQLVAVPPGLTRPHTRAADELADYLRQDWGTRRVRADFDTAGGYARTHGIRLVCNEFGVIRANVDPGSRYRWMADVRGAAEANGLGWTLWDYTDIFGITAESAQPGRTDARTVEPAAVRALGLNTAAAAR